MSLFGLGGSNATIDIRLDGIESRRHYNFKDKNGTDNRLPVFTVRKINQD
jgi:hypothetical protein